jgi:hypothetical protein
MTQAEKIELIERERDGWQNDADDHKRRGCVAHYEHEQAMADVLTEAMTALRSGWVRTSERVPEVGQWFIPIVLMKDDWGTGLIMLAGEDVARYLENHNWQYWFPVPSLPPLPEVDA